MISGSTSIFLGLIILYAVLFFFFCTKAVEPVDSIMENNVKRGIKQPVIIALGLRGNINQVFLVVEGQAFEIRRGIIAAVDRLVKLHFIMDIAYAVPAHHILHYVQKFVMNISDELPVCRSVLDLVSHCK